MTSFLRLVEDLLREPTERAAYLADPAGYLPARGFADFDSADVEMSLELSADALPPALAARLDAAQGLETVVSVDIDDLPGLWGPADADPVSLEELSHGDDPFLDGDDHDAVVGEDGTGEGVDDAFDPDGVDSTSFDGAPGAGSDFDGPDAGDYRGADGVFDDAFDHGFPADAGLDAAESGFVEPVDDDAPDLTGDPDLDVMPSLDDDVPSTDPAPVCGRRGQVA